MSDVVADERTETVGKLRVLHSVVTHKSRFTASIIGLGVLTAFLEGIGLSFILPIIQIAQEGSGAASESKLVATFISIYDFFGVPSSLEFLIGGAILVMFVRYGSSFLVSLLTAKLRASYEKDLKLRAFEKTVNARVEFFDKSGSDTILNIIITQARKGSNVITLIVRLVERIFLITMYLAIALYLAPLLTVLTVFVIGGVTYVVRNVLESGYAAGDRVADADENVQESVQAGTQGIRDVKLFGSENDIFSEFVSHIDYYVRSKVSVQRNKAAINSFYSFLSAATLFSLVYFSFTFTDLTFQDLGLFLITMFRLAPQANSLNNIVYKVETGLPHLTRTENFIAELDDNQESSNHSRQMPVPVT